MRVLLAGATGAIGKPLLRRLIERGHEVVATTRSSAKVEWLRNLGGRPMVVDLLDANRVAEAVSQSRAQAIIHQATALSGPPDLKHFDRWFAATNLLRTRGLDHLLAAARRNGVECFVAQSFTGWNNARVGSAIKTEEDPLDEQPVRTQKETLSAIQYLERTVLGSPMRGIVLRYGAFYGPGASESMVELVRRRRFPLIGSAAGVWSWIHVDDAAAATVAAMEAAAAGIYQIVDDEPARVAEWLPFFASAIGAKPPLRIPEWLGRVLAGEAAVTWMTQGRGASNAKARRTFGLELKWPTWRDGFRYGLGIDAPSRYPESGGAGGN